MKLARARARPKQPGTMNRLESAYSLVLEAQKRSGKILDYRYEGMRLVLAKATTYTPDFMVILANGEVEFHETKGFMRDDAWCKLKVAATSFPWFRFMLVRKVGKNGWDISEVAA